MVPKQHPLEIEAFRVVCLGGGTGLSTILRGLKHMVLMTGQTLEDPPPVCIAHLTAVVTVTDDGGSSGRLRKELNVPPPGDIRNCMVALAEDEALMSRLFQYRFSAGVGLEGHNFGNLFLTALANLRGDFAEAVKVSSQILKTRGDIVPSTTSDVQLTAQMADGSLVRGETKITASKSRILKLAMEPPDAAPLPNTLEEIASADLITIGPGSLFTSLIPNLLVHGIPEAIRESKALKVYVGNLMTQANESLGMTASQHIQALFAHAGGKFFDYALLNQTPIPKEMAERYAAEGGEPIVIDLDAVRALGVQPVLGDYLAAGDVARHNADRIAHDLMQLLSERNAAEREDRATMIADAEKSTRR
jgi:uncharacterized cofD-like protein